MTRLTRRATLGAVVVAIAAAAATAVTLSARAPVARYTANALNIGGDAGRPPATLVQIDIDRWSTDEEQNQMAAPLAGNRQSEAAAILTRLPRVGSIRALDLAGEPIYYARRAVRADLSEHILLVASRPLRAFEASMKPNMSAFPFSAIELNVDASGKGTGTLTLAATLSGAPERPIIPVPDRLILPVTLTKVERAK
jgi:hypothetical protein